MIKDIFNGIDLGIGAALYADDGTLWKRGRDIDYITEVLQKALTDVERWSTTWGFRLSVSKSNYVFLKDKY